MTNDNKDIEMIYVKGDTGKGRVALWERHEFHPHPEGERLGEVMVTDEPAYIAVTPKVRVALRMKELVEISKEEHDTFWANRQAEIEKSLPDFNSDVLAVEDPLATIPEIIAERKANADAQANTGGNKEELKPAENPPVATKKSGAK